MFLQSLTREQKLAFVELAREFIRSDQRQTAEEEETLAKLAAEMGVPADLGRKANRSTLLTTFDSRRSRVAVLLEILAVGFADRELAAQEDAFVQEIATLFGIAQDELERLESWVERYAALMREANELMVE